MLHMMNFQTAKAQSDQQCSFRACRASPCQTDGVKRKEAEIWSSSIQSAQTLACLPGGESLAIIGSTSKHPTHALAFHRGQSDCNLLPGDLDIAAGGNYGN